MSVSPLWAVVDLPRVDRMEMMMSDGARWTLLLSCLRRLEMFARRWAMPAWGSSTTGRDGVEDLPLSLDHALLA